MKPVLFVMLLAGLVVSTAEARGRRPEGEDGFPDYNRLELRKKQPDVPADQPAAPPTPILKPTLNAPLNTPANEEDKPKPLPAAVPTKDNSEPALPDDMLNTLVPGTTGQSPAPSAVSSK